MTRMSWVTVAILALFLAIPVLGSADVVIERTDFREKGAFAEWQYTEGDVSTYITVVTAELSQKPNKGTLAPFVSVSILRVSTVDGTLLFAGAGSTEQLDFTVDNQLSTARVIATVPVVDVTVAEVIDFTVDMTWTATGPVVRERGAFHFHDAGFIFNVHFNGDHRKAQATGSVIGHPCGILCPPAPINFTPVPSMNGQIQDNKSGSVSIVVHPFIPEDLVRTLDGTTTGEAFFGEQALSVAVDRRDHVIAAGHTQNTGTGADFTVAKWDAGGNLLWLRTIDGTAGTDDFGHSVAVDSQNNVIAAGLTRNAKTGADFTAAKWDANGNLQWLRTIDGIAEDFFVEQALAVAVDSQDNVIAAGLTDNTGDGQDADFTVVKWDARGNLLWLRTLEGSGRANAVVVDSRGSVIAAGHSLGPNNDDFLAAQWDANGNLQWHRTLNGTADQADDAFSVAVDSQDSVVVAGFTRNANTREDFTVAKWDARGNLLWLRTIDGDGVVSQGSDQAFAVTVDSQNNVVAAGLINAAGGIGLFSVVKWDANGNQQWLRIKTNHDMRSEPALAVAVDSQDDVVAVGHTTVDILAIKWDASGNQQWLRTIDGTAGSIDQAVAVAVDSQDRVIASGSTTNTDTEQDFTVVWLCTNCP